MPLFEIAVLRHWEDENEKDCEELVIEPGYHLAKNEKAAALGFVLGHRVSHELDELDADELEIIVRPFA